MTNRHKTALYVAAIAAAALAPQNPRKFAFFSPDGFEFRAQIGNLL